MRKLVFILAFGLFLNGVFNSLPTKSILTDTEKATDNVLSVATDWGLTPTPTTEPTPTPSYIADHVVISEVQITGGTGKTDNDFVELYNPTSSAINLSGWKLRKRISSGSESSLVVIGSGKIIPAHGFFLWANSEGEFATSVGADESTTAYITEDNSVALLTPSDVIVDQVAWGNGTNQFVEGTAFTDNPVANQSIERKAYSTSTAISMGIGGSDEFKGNGFDSNNNATDFVLRSVSQPQNNSSPIEIP